MVKNRKKPSVKTKDLKPKEDPKGGGIYIKYGSVTGETLTPKRRSVGRNARDIKLKSGID